LLGSPELSLWAKCRRRGGCHERVGEVGGWRGTSADSGSEFSLIITCIGGFPALSIKLEDIACVFLGQTKARAMGDSSRKKIDGKYKKIRGNNEVYTQDLTWEIAATTLENASNALNTLRARHHVKAKRISTSGPRHPHKEESLVRTSKHVPAHHLILGKRTRTGLDPNRKAHEQSRSSHRQSGRCTWREFPLVRNRACLRG